MTIFFIQLKNIFSRFLVRRYVNEKISKTLFLAFFFNILFGILFFFTEQGTNKNLTFLDSVWWSMVTMTTVGYGDITAQTFSGRFFVSYPCMLIGIGIIGYLVGITAETVMDNANKRRKGLVNITYENHVIICNFPGFEKVEKVLLELKAFPKYKKSRFVLITDRFEELPDNLNMIGLGFVNGSPTNEEILIKANITKSSGVFILANDPNNINSDEKSFAIASIVKFIEKEQNIKIKTVIDLVSKSNYKMIKRSETDGIVSIEGIRSCLLVQEFLYPGINNIFQDLISNRRGSQFYIFDTMLESHKISEIQVAVLKHKTNLQLIGIIKGEKQILNPPKTMVIEKNDKLIILAESPEDFKEIEKDISPC